MHSPSALGGEDRTSVTVTADKSRKIDRRLFSPGGTMFVLIPHNYKPGLANRWGAL
jgi:hypothetical protein